MMIALLLATTLAGCIATDGDSLRCGAERIRLLGIDAPEIARCPPTRRCAPGHPTASRDSLRKMIAGQALGIARVGKDRYGRTLAVVHAAGLNLSCGQLARGAAAYRRDWDDGARIRHACPRYAR